MSERAPRSPESHHRPHKSPESIKSRESGSEALKTPEKSPHELQEMTKHAHEKAAHSTDVLQSLHTDSETEHSTAPTWTSPALRNRTFTNVMRSTRRKLSPVDRTFSRVIHNDAVDRASEVGAQTIARPPAILLGALVSLVGSVVVLVIARRSGFEVPPMLFVFLFIGGYLTGLMLDILVRGLAKTFRR